jgi:hypothetical protein
MNDKPNHYDYEPENNRRMTKEDLYLINDNQVSKYVEEVIDNSGTKENYSDYISKEIEGAESIIKHIKFGSVGAVVGLGALGLGVGLVASLYKKFNNKQKK